MARNRVHLEASPERVFAVLSDARRDGVLRRVGTS
jgi:hypothetical protein